MRLNRNSRKVKNNTTTLIQNRKSTMMKTAAISALLISCLVFNTSFASAKDNNNLQKIYHVYVSNQYLGATSDEQSIQKYIDEKVSEASKQYSNLQLRADSNLSIVSEQVFQQETNNEETMKKIREALTVEASAFALSVNDQVAVYVKDLAAYEETLRLLKLKFVSEEELEALNARKQSLESLPPLQNDETRIVDIFINEKISGVTKYTKPDQVRSPQEAVDVLLKGTLEEQKYSVQEGDVLGSIAAKHNLTSAEMMALNPGITDDTLLQIGQELNVTVLKPILNVEVIKESKATETIPYENIVEENAELFKGDTSVKQEGAEGQREVSYAITEQNGVQLSKTVQEEKVLVEPKNHIVEKGTKVMPSRGSGNFSWPTQGGYISSEMGYRWGAFHRGIDIARPSGFAIKAADNGVVIEAGYDGGFGNKIVIDHKNGYQTTYGHLSSIGVSVGQTVTQGSQIGVMGSTGDSTGVHLHFEVCHNGQYINPLTVLKK